MVAKKYLFSGFLSSLVMFGLSCFWHGMVLNDFIRITYPKSIFLLLLALLYVVISLIMLMAYRYLRVVELPVKNGMIIGAVTGGVVFLIAFVLGLSFSSDFDPLFALIDLTWQVIEQFSGALVMALVYQAVERRESLFEV